MSARKVTARQQALAVVCPKCGAMADDPCVGRSGPRRACHIERHELAVRLGAQAAGKSPTRKPAAGYRTELTADAEAEDNERRRRACSRLLLLGLRGARVRRIGATVHAARSSAVVVWRVVTLG
jgi:hypothetical protein